MSEEIKILDADLDSILKNPFDDVQKIEGQLYRLQPGRKTISFTIRDKTYFAKIHSGVGWKEIIKNIVQLRWPIIGAKSEWDALIKLQMLGIKAPIPVAFGQRGVNPAKLNSFIITKAISYTMNLEEFFKAREKISFSYKKQLIEKVAEIAKRLHENGINHRDFYLCHFLLDENGSVIYLIDWHRAQMRSKTPFRWRVKDISGLYFSTMDFKFTRRDYLRFIRCYTGESLALTLKRDRFFWRMVNRKAKRLYRKLIFP